MQTEALQRCDFPGNVRELNNLMELSIDDCGVILGGDTDRARSRKASPEVVAPGVRRGTPDAATPPVRPEFLFLP